MRYIITFLFCLFLSSFLFAQNSFKVSGQVLFGEEKNAAEGASIFLVNQDSSVKKGQFANKDGLFQLKNLPSGTYFIQISLAGYQSQKDTIRLENQDFYMGEILLVEASYNLDKVVIEGEEATAEQKGDTLEFNASAFTTNPDANTEDLVQKMPGIVMENGQIKAQGEAVEQVLVDGKPFFGKDPKAALQNLPADVVKNIQIIDQQSDQAQFTGFQDGETTKTINVVTKPEKRKGKFGRIFGGYGYPDNRYQLGTSTNLFSGDRRITLLGQTNNINQQNFAAEDLQGISGGGRRRRWGRGPADQFLVNSQGGITTTHAAGINFSDEWNDKIEISGSYFFNYSDNDALTETSQTYLIEGDTGQVYQEVSQSNTQNINHRLNMRIEYKINENNEIRLRPSFSYQQNSGTSLDSGQTSLGSLISNDFRNSLRTNFSAISFSNTITFNHKFNEAGRSISIELDTDYDNDSGDKILDSEVNYYTEQASLEMIDQNSIRESNQWDVELEVGFNEPIGEWGRFEIEYEFNPRINDASTRTFAFDPTAERYSRLDTSLSNVFLNEYNRHELGTGLRISLNEGKFVANLSMGYQTASLENAQTFPFDLDTRTRFSGLVSRAYIRYNMSKERNFRFYYRGESDPPSISQLQDVVDNSNPLQLSTGNPNLEQSYRHFGILRYSFTNTKTSSNWYSFIRGSYIQNFVGNATFIAGANSRQVNGITLQPGAQLTLPQNLGDQVDLSGNLSYGRQLKKLKVNVNADLSLNYTRTPSLINSALNFSNNYRLGLGITLSSNISENVDFTLSSRGNVNQVLNSLQENLNNQFYSQNSSFRMNLIFWEGIVLRSQVYHQLFTGLADGFNQSFWLWNGSIGKKLFKKDQGEISISVFDALGQNTSIQRNVTSTYIEDVRNVVLQRYFMLRFTYNFRKFSGGKGMGDQEGRPPYGRHRP